MSEFGVMAGKEAHLGVKVTRAKTGEQSVLLGRKWVDHCGGDLPTALEAAGYPRDSTVEVYDDLIEHPVEGMQLLACRCGGCNAEWYEPPAQSRPLYHCPRCGATFSTEATPDA